MLAGSPDLVVTGEDILHLFRRERMPLDVEDVFIVPLEPGNDHTDIISDCIYDALRREALQEISRSGFTHVSVFGHARFDYPVDLPRGQLVGSFALRFLADYPKDVGLRSREADIITDGDRFGLRGARLVDDGRVGFILDAARELVKVLSHGESFGSST